MNYLGKLFSTARAMTFAEAQTNIEVTRSLLEGYGSWKVRNENLINLVHTGVFEIHDLDLSDGELCTLIANLCATGLCIHNDGDGWDEIESVARPDEVMAKLYEISCYPKEIIIQVSKQDDFGRFSYVEFSWSFYDMSEGKYPHVPEELQEKFKTIVGECNPDLELEHMIRKYIGVQF